KGAKDFLEHIDSEKKCSTRQIVHLEEKRSSSRIGWAAHATTSASISPAELSESSPFYALPALNHEPGNNLRSDETTRLPLVGAEEEVRDTPRG
ncbi:hypothetical protein TSAR_002877, partial [Trichomalopsis sarcophagae]